jgi:hypothetical protein
MKHLKSILLFSLLVGSFVGCALEDGEEPIEEFSAELRNVPASCSHEYWACYGDCVDGSSTEFGCCMENCRYVYEDCIKGSKEDIAPMSEEELGGPFECPL